MAVMPDRFRQICNFQSGGRKLRPEEIAHASKSKTEGTPRNRTICESDAPKSAATLMQAPITANMAQASNIHNDCIKHPTPIIQRRYYTFPTIFWFDRRHIRRKAWIAAAPEKN